MVAQIRAPVPIQKAFLNYKNEATADCPGCFTTHAVFFIALDENSHDKIRIDCPCGCRFDIELDARRAYRKKVCIPGICVDMDSGKPWKMTIVDLSISGVGIKTQQKTRLRGEQQIEIKFVLNNEKLKEISKTAIIKRIKSNFIGAEFSDIESHFEELSNYIQSI